MHDPKKWDELATTWQDAGPPATPSREDLHYFARLLGAPASHSAILILGSTPSLRSLLAGRCGNSKVVCVDFSQRMYEATSAILGTMNPNESFVCSDWTQMELGSESFSAVIGDKAIDNVHPSRWRAFFSAVHRVLKKRGIFVVHMAFSDLSFRGITVEQSLRKWASLVRETGLEQRDAIAGLWEDLLTASAFYGGEYFNTVRVDRFEKEIMFVRDQLRGISDSVENHILEGFIHTFGTSVSSEWSSYTLEDIVTITSDLFSVDEIEFSTDYMAARFQPIVRLTKRD